MMSLLKRIWRSIRASLTNEAEDPEKLLEEAVMEMQDKLVELRQAVASAIATQKRNERHLTQHRDRAEEWRSRAMLALEKGNENLAREALLRGRTYQNHALALQVQIEQQSGIVNRLKQDLQVLENKISEARVKKNIYIARARSAAATQKIRELVENINTGSYLDAFERIEAKVMELEAYSEIASGSGRDSLEQKFAALERASQDESSAPKLEGERENKGPGAKEI